MQEIVPPHRHNKYDQTSEKLASNESIRIGGASFTGPFSDREEILPLPGIFGIVCQSNEHLELLTLDESHCLKDCLTSSEYEDNMLFLSENCAGSLRAIVHYTPGLTAVQRVKRKNELLAQFMMEVSA